MAPPTTGYTPNLDIFLKTLKGRSPDAAIDDLASLLRRGQIRGSESCALVTAHVLLQVVARSKWTDVDHLLDRIHQVGLKLAKAQPYEPVIGNIVRRVTALVRDEASEDRAANESASETASEAPTPSPLDASSRAPPVRPRPFTLTTSTSFPATPSMFNILSADLPVESSPSGSGASTPLLGPTTQMSVQALRSEVIDGIEEIKDEILQVDDQIASFADAQIHPGENVLVHNPSPTVQRFLVGAAKKRRFTVFITGNRPRTTEETTPFAVAQKKLSAAKIPTVIVSDSNVATIMPQMSRVILDARAVGGEGGFLADAGTSLVTLAAKEYAKPITVLCGVYKLCPESSFQPSNLVELGSADEYVDFAEGLLVNGADVINASCEYVPDDAVDVYLTNLGPHSLNHIQSVIADHYKIEDLSVWMS